MSGKGDSPRPLGITPAEYVKLWDATFGHKEEGTKHETRPVPCDRCNGAGVLWESYLVPSTVQESRVCPSCQGQCHVQENVK
jgi:DnaJ-class molecular chaperone